MGLKIKYDGKQYNNINDAVNDAMINGVKDHFKKALKPFEKEIAKYDGIITVNIPKDFKNANIEITNIPDDLKNKIITTLQ